MTAKRIGTRNQDGNQETAPVDAAFCRKLLMYFGKDDLPSAGTLGAVMYNLKIFDAEAGKKRCSTRKLIAYLARPKYEHHLRPSLLATLEQIKIGANRSNPAALISSKISKQLHQLYELELIKYFCNGRWDGSYLTATGIELFSGWPSLTAPASRRFEHAVSRACYAERKFAEELKTRQELEKKVRQLEWDDRFRKAREQQKEAQTNK
jgi:hypothetical protein